MHIKLKSPFDLNPTCTSLKKKKKKKNHMDHIPYYFQSFSNRVKKKNIVVFNQHIVWCTCNNVAKLTKKLI